MRAPWVDKYGVLNIVDKPPKAPPARFTAEVNRKIENSTGVGGWRKGPRYICSEAQDEAIDVPAWLRGLDEFPKPPGADRLRDEIGRDAAALFEKIERLKGMYGEP